MGPSYLFEVVSTDSKTNCCLCNFYRTAELKARLLASESELRQSCLNKEQLEIDLRNASKRLQTLEEDARIRDTVCKEHTERLAIYDVRREELEKMTSESQAKVV